MTILLRLSRERDKVLGPVRPCLKTFLFVMVTEWSRSRTLGGHVMSLSLVSLKTRQVERPMHVQSFKAQTSYHWYGVEDRRGVTSSDVVFVA
ncbi:hypothetical protein TNCV_578771 [Trichonephila clavipes]|nr:hypothetical protein TNCV_578771 [Trichonephila clavipes]